jgi:hypothetical protein
VAAPTDGGEEAEVGVGTQEKLVFHIECLTVEFRAFDQQRVHFAAL